MELKEYWHETTLNELKSGAAIKGCRFNNGNEDVFISPNTLFITSFSSRPI
jgi:hypothetical protein